VIDRLLVLGTWISPVVLAVLAARVAAGHADASILVAALIAAPLLGLSIARGDDRPPAVDHSRTVVLAGAIVLVLAANFVVMGDLARVLGLHRLHGVIAAAVLALGVIAWSGGHRWWRLAPPIGAALVLLPLAAVIVTTQSPRAAWVSAAERPALTFDARSAWVTDGRAVGDRTTLTFYEAHRVVAASAASWRVVEKDAVRMATRDFQLAAGDALTLRPGDQLTLAAGTRVRFEAGRRVPGAPTSGAAWADGRRRSFLVALGTSVGIALTLAGGAHALAPAAPLLPGLRALAVPLALAAFVLGAALWGLYGAALAPDLTLTPRALAPLTEVVSRISAPPWRHLLIAAVVAGVIGVLLGTVRTCRARFREIADESGLSSRVGLGALIASVALAGGAAWWSADAWRLFAWALGIAVCGVVAPALARAGARGETIGRIAGVLAFVAVAYAGHRLTEYPAVVAAPLSWLVARLARPR